MSKAIKFDQSHKLVPGVVIFHVIGSGQKIKTVDDITEVKITRSPYNQPFNGSTNEVLWMDGITTYTNFAGEKVAGINRARSLRDGGLPRDGRIHNLNRFFWTKEDAAEFIQELNSGVFSDPLDQEEYGKRDSW